jgi:hypothetical protein
LIALAMLGHHKDFEALLEYLPTKQMIEEYRDNPISDAVVNPLDFKDNLLKKLNVSYLVDLRDKMETYYGRFAGKERKLAYHDLDFSNSENPVKD